MCVTLVDRVSKHRVQLTRIFEESPHENSAAAYILLKRQYALMDIERKWKLDWRYYFISRRTFLRRKRNERGGFWVCHYCGMVIEEPKKITVDHKIPKVKVYDPTDSSNFLECCSDCNTDKGAMSYEDFVYLIGGVPEIEVIHDLTSFNILDFLFSKLLVIFNYLKNNTIWKQNWQTLYVPAGTITKAV